MKAYSTYHIRENDEKSQIRLIVTDENPKGVTLTIKDNAPEGTMTSFNLPRMEMIEALEYVLNKIKAGV